MYSKQMAFIENSAKKSNFTKPVRIPVLGKPLRAKMLVGFENPGTATFPVFTV